MDERARIASFLKKYIEERLRDPETRAINSSPQFGLARQEFINAQTLENLGRAAENFLRINRRRSEELGISSDPDRIPDSLPLNVRERSLLFNGRAPDHHTREMRELRINYGISRLERSDRVEKLSRGLIEPSDSLRQILDELETRKTAKAIGHFQATLFNPEMKSTSSGLARILFAVDVIKPPDLLSVTNDHGISNGGADLTQFRDEALDPLSL